MKWIRDINNNLVNLDGADNIYVQHRDSYTKDWAVKTETEASIYTLFESSSEKSARKFLDDLYEELK